MSAKNEFVMFAGLGVAAVLGLAWLAKRAKSAASAALTAVNPLSTHNVIYESVNKTGAALSADPAFSLGGWFYSATHKDPMMQSTLPAPTDQPPRMGDAGLPLLNLAGTGEPGSGYDYIPGGSFEAAKSAPAADPYPWWPSY